MRILQVGSSMPDDWGGIERYVTFLTGALAARGHEVALTAPAGSPLASRSTVSLIPLRVRQKYDLTACAAYLRLFRATNYDIVNTHFSPDYLVPAWAAKLAHQKGTVLTRHVAVPFRSNRARQYSRLYERFIGVSGATVASLTASGLDPNLCMRVDTGIPALKPKSSRHEAREKLGGDPDAFKVGIVGRLVPEKGHEVLMNAAMKGGFEVHVIGDGPLLSDLRYRFGRPEIRFHGRVPETADFMIGLDTVCVPSIWEEALGLVVLEAMSLGLPIIASNVGGIPEAVAHGSTGLLVPPGDPDALASSISRLKADRELALALGTQGQAVFLASRQPESMASQTEIVYQTMLG